MQKHGGDIIAEILQQQGVTHLYTLCGGHISPLLTGAKARGIHVVDMRDERSATFAADATARITGVPGVVAVTAGPGLTNTITAVQNARMAESPLVLFAGATATMLKGRGALQDIDQMALIRGAVKQAWQVRAVRDLVPVVEHAFRVAQEGIPGPVCVEVPVDILYPEHVVRQWTLDTIGKTPGVVGKALQLYARQHLFRQFAGAGMRSARHKVTPSVPQPGTDDVDVVARLLQSAQRPVFVLGSQTVSASDSAQRVAGALHDIGAPVFLGGMARGLLGAHSALQFRHKRTQALKQADVVVVCGFPFDFRLGYGASIGGKAKVIAVGRDRAAITQNRRPTRTVTCDAGAFLIALAQRMRGGGGPAPTWGAWFAQLQANEHGRDAEIVAEGAAATDFVNPIALCQAIETHMAKDAVIVVDGGDFAATAAYVLRPRSPLCWLDPGVFGTLGVGGGFATAAALLRKQAETWLIWGDGSSAYSLAEFDTWVRHGIAPICVIGNDGSWQQIARDQVEILHDACGTVLRRSDYHKVAEGYGGVGLLLDDPKDITSVIMKAKNHAAAGKPVCINALIGATAFRKGSLSI